MSLKTLGYEIKDFLYFYKLGNYALTLLTRKLIRVLILQELASYIKLLIGNHSIILSLPNNKQIIT